MVMVTEVSENRHGDDVEISEFNNKKREWEDFVYTKTVKRKSVD